MPIGYLVTLGNDALDSGDAISGSQSSFTISNTIGSGSWTWTGVWDGDGQTYSNITDTGTYYFATDGNTYFVPDTWYTTSGTANVTAVPSNVYSGAAGNDSYSGTTGDDVIYGSDGNDYLTGRQGNDLIFGGEGNDTYDTDLGDDTFYGGGGDDWVAIYQNMGGESLYGGETGETLGDMLEVYGDFAGVDVTVTFTGDGDGTVTFNGETANFWEFERFFLHSGDDSIDASVATSDLNIQTADGDNLIVGGAGNDTIDSGDGSDTIYGGGGSNSLSGGLGDDIFVSDGTDDTIHGGAGHDIIDQRLNSSSFNVDTFSGIEEIYGSSGGDSWNWAVDPILFHGGSGNDSLNAGTGNDTIEGGAGDDTIDGNGGADSITGGAGDDRFIYTAGDGNDTITDFNTGNSGTLDDGDNTNNDFINLSGFYDHISELYADQADDGILNQSNATDTRGMATDYSGNSQFGAGSLRFQGASADSSSFTAENTGVVCFCAGTRILTPAGTCLIEELQIGDLVCTYDQGPLPIRWIGHQTLSSPGRHAPIRIAENALGTGFPNKDLLVSPQHRILLSSKIAERVLGNRELLVPAKKLLGLPNIAQMNGDIPVTYWHLLFEEHQVVKANGAWAESLFPGPQALKALGPTVKEELTAIMPHVLEAARSQHLGIARETLCGRKLQNLLARHLKNDKPLFAVL